MRKIYTAEECAAEDAYYEDRKQRKFKEIGPKITKLSQAVLLVVMTAIVWSYIGFWTFLVSPLLVGVVAGVLMVIDENEKGTV